MMLPPRGVDADATGRFEMRDFRLVDQPFLVRLLSAGSFTGLLDLLRGAGIRIDTLSADVGMRGDRLTARGIDPTANDLDPGVAARCAALVRCAESGVPTDLQGLLVQGDPMGGIRPDIVGLILGLPPVRREPGSEFAVYDPPTPINWRDDPGAIVEDDEPQIGRDHA